MITLTGNGRLTRDVQLRTTNSGKTVATISIASDRRDRNTGPVYLDLIVWQTQAAAAAAHLVKGQAVSFSGRFEPREYVSSSGDQRVALELHRVHLEYAPKPRASEPVPAAPDAARCAGVAAVTGASDRAAAVDPAAECKGRLLDGSEDDPRLAGSIPKPLLASGAPR